MASTGFERPIPVIFEDMMGEVSHSEMWVGVRGISRGTGRSCHKKPPDPHGTTLSCKVLELRCNLATESHVLW